MRVQTDVDGEGRSLTLADLCGGRDNNLNLIRVIAASSVIISHSFLITRGTGPEPLQTLTGHTLGWLAVAIFFIISGFLIARSYDRRLSGWHWLLARILRLAPGLFVMSLLTVFVLGPFVTTLPVITYFSKAETWTYLPKDMVLAFIQVGLPEVFPNNPVPHVINGSLWTLFNEVACYGLVFLTGWMGLLRKKFAFGIGVALFIALYALASGLDLKFGPRFDPLIRLALPFVLGMAAYVWRDRLLLDWRLVGPVWIVAVIAWFTPVFTPFYILAVGYTTLVFAYRPKGALLRYNRLGDYSYGVYIYAFPLQQLMVYLVPGQSWATNIALAFPPTLLCAILSWHLVEKRSLALAKPAAERWMAFWRREGAGVIPDPAR